MKLKEKFRRLRHFNDLDFPCDECCLKNEKECMGDKEFCAVHYDKTVIREHRVWSNKYKGANEDKIKDIDFSHGIPNEPESEEIRQDIYSLPIEARELCGQGRCMECRQPLC